MDWEMIGAAMWDWVPWLIGVAGLLFGILGELRARRAERRASRDDDAPPWDDAQHDSGDLFTIRNTSTRDVIVTAVEASPAEKAGLLRFRHKFPLTIYAGDSLGVLGGERYSMSRPDVVIVWRFVDADEIRRNRRILPSATS
ncbi:hypothetical protein [Microbacterium sp.]|uniref:hypothetical protein n=1 Tax=Microbacterium sp. TaxID=51671 RepID=UPI0035646252